MLTGVPGLDASFHALIRTALAADPPPAAASCGFGRMPRSWVMGPRTLAEPLIYFVLDGAIEGEIDGQLAQLRPLSLLWLPPGIRHRLAVAPGARAPLLYYFRPVLPSLPRLARAASIRHHVQSLRGPCGAFFAAMTEDHPLREARVRASLASLLCAVADALRGPAAQGGHLSQDQRARMRIELERLGSAATPAALARRLGLGPRHFTRRFTATFGAPPRVWLVRDRLRRAAQALSESVEPIGALAARFGFADPFRFSRAFKQLYGVSPRSWRAARAGIA